MRLEFSPAAQFDLIEIASFIARDNPARAYSYVDELEKTCEALSDFPELGPARPELGEGVRMLPYENYLIFYRIYGDHIRIERVLHGARDINALFEG